MSLEMSDTEVISAVGAARMEVSDERRRRMGARSFCLLLVGFKFDWGMGFVEGGGFVPF